jgi:hypothetical protein
MLAVNWGVSRPAGATANPDNSAVSVGAGVRYICQTSAPIPVGRARSWVRCSDGAYMYTSATNVDSQVSTGSGAAYTTLADEGSSLTQRSTLNFTGAGVACADNSGSSRTDCTITGTLQSAYTAGGSSGGTITETVSGGPLGLLCGADANKGLYVKANSPSQSGDLFETQNSSGTARFAIVPTDSGDNHRVVITSNVNGSPDVLEFHNTVAATLTKWIAGSVLQLASGGDVFQIFNSSFGAQFAQFDANGIQGFGGFATNYRTASSVITAAITDHFIGVSGTGSRTVNLPAASTCIKVGQEIIVQDVGNSSGTITINANGGDTINGAATATIAAVYGSKTLYCDHSSAWFAH